jgi:hypothetical protein
VKTLWRASDRDEVRQRARRLVPGATPAWGRMNAPQMIAHVTDQLRMSLGRLPVASVSSPFRFPPLKQLAVYWLPWPKGAPTLPELLARSPGAWGTEIDELSQLVDDFGTRDAREPWPVHPIFGAMSREAWGRLGYRHLDHHFRQFRI